MKKACFLEFSLCFGFDLKRKRRGGFGFGKENPTPPHLDQEEASLSPGGEMIPGYPRRIVFLGLFSEYESLTYRFESGGRCGPRLSTDFLILFLNL